MNIEFVFGVFIVLIVNKIPPKYIFPILIAGIVLFLFGAWVNNCNIDFVGKISNWALNRVLLFGFPSFLIVLALVKLELNKNIHLHSLFLKFGDASYSIYLIHLPIVVAYFKIIAKLKIQDTSVLLFCCFFVLFIVCLLGIWVYQNIEKPLIKALNRQF